MNWLTTNSPSPLNIPIWALDGFNMTMRSVFNGYLPTIFQTLLEYEVGLDLLPRPAAVGVGYINAQRPAFGFGGGSFGAWKNTNQNFNNGTFYNIFIEG